MKRVYIGIAIFALIAVILGAGQVYQLGKADTERATKSWEMTLEQVKDEIRVRELDPIAPIKQDMEAKVATFTDKDGRTRFGYWRSDACILTAASGLTVGDSVVATKTGTTTPIPLKVASVDTTNRVAILSNDANCVIPTGLGIIQAQATLFVASRLTNGSLIVNRGYASLAFNPGGLGTIETLVEVPLGAPVWQLNLGFVGIIVDKHQESEYVILGVMKEYGP